MDHLLCCFAAPPPPSFLEISISLPAATRLVHAAETDSIEFQPAHLEITDYYHGPARRAEVSVCIAGRTVYIRSEKPLPKREFEHLFGFGCGMFTPGRVIAVDCSAIGHAAPWHCSMDRRL